MYIPPNSQSGILQNVNLVMSLPCSNSEMMSIHQSPPVPYKLFLTMPSERWHFNLILVFLQYSNDYTLIFKAYPDLAPPQLQHSKLPGHTKLPGIPKPCALPSASNTFIFFRMATDIALHLPIHPANSYSSFGLSLRFC